MVKSYFLHNTVVRQICTAVNFKGVDSLETNQVAPDHNFTITGLGENVVTLFQ